MRRVLASLNPVLSRVETVERRLIGLEDAQKQTAGNVAMIPDTMRDKKFPPQKVFFDGEFFDAFVQMKKFIRHAKKDFVVIDPYFDDACLPLIARKRPGVTVTVVRSAKPHLANRLSAADIAQFNKQYANSLTVKLTDKFHDRYLIIDNVTLIHVGASLNHLGKRCFAFSTLASEFIPDIMARVAQSPVKPRRSTLPRDDCQPRDAASGRSVILWERRLELRNGLIRCAISFSSDCGF